VSYWQWWYSRDKEQWWPVTTREEAIALGTKEYEGESFSICEARLKPLKDDFFQGWCVVEEFEEANEEVLSPDGPAKTPTDEALRELEVALAATWFTWRTKHDLFEPWAFAEQRNEEQITPE
jgi:hypothetical protein